MDDKAKLILEHYKQLIEENRFDEYDILGFLIFIRSSLKKQQYPGIYEFCDLVAHRNRDRGTVMDCINTAISNNYQTLPATYIVKDYHGIDDVQWRNEWTQIGQTYQISLSENTIKEMMICIFSLAQNASYLNNSGSGKLVLSQTIDGYLSLDTTEGKPDSNHVSFSTFGPYRFLYNYQVGMIKDIVETKREGKELHLYGGKKRII